MVHMAMAFAMSHPAVTSAIIGPRTMEQLDDVLAGAEVTLDDEVLDRIDEIVPPGVDANPGDVSYEPPAIGDGVPASPTARGAGGGAGTNSLQRRYRSPGTRNTQKDSEHSEGVSRWAPSPS